MIEARGLSAKYNSHVVFRDVDLTFPRGKITTLIGPNGCGKSTLLKSIATVHPFEGHVSVDGDDVMQMKRTHRARVLSMLPQQPTAPEALTVEQLVARGRHPHQSWLQRAGEEDERVVRDALRMTGTTGLAKRALSDLSGGQRQRVWIAMTLAQATPVVLLDEPTTYLDLSHSIELLNVVRNLRDEQGKTIVMVLHDLNLAARYSDNIVAMDAQGAIRAQGDPKDVFTSELLGEVFDLRARVIPDPVSGGALVVPEL